MAADEYSENHPVQRELLLLASDEHDLSRFQHFRREASSLNRTALAPNPILESWATRLYIPYSEEDSYCGCYTDKLKIINCECGEHGKRIEWVWDEGSKSNCINLSNKNKDVKFHQYYSNGTAVIRGAQSMTANQHYWEVKMISQVYGTDMMVGIGTKNADINKLNDRFCSFLGIDSETWGLSYTGLFHHNGKSEDYAPHFGQGSIIGLHLDMWNGTLAFYKNRKPLGIASTGLKGKTFYAMASSTAARSGMRIIRSCSFPSSLQFICCSKLRKLIPRDKNVLDMITVPPGLQSFLENNLGWLLGERPLDEHLLKQSCSTNPPCKCKHTCGKQNESISNTEEQYLSDGDCSGTLSDYSITGDNSNDGFVLLGSSAIAFQDYNRFRRAPLELGYDDCDDSVESDSKKCKYSYNYIVGLSDPDSD